MARIKTGSIYQRDDKSWWARITYTDETGKRRERWRRAENKSHAKELAKQLVREFDDHGGKTLDAAQMTFADLVTYYKENYVFAPNYVDGRKVAGLRSWHSLLSRIAVLKEHFNKRRIRSITFGDLQKFRSVRLNTKTKRGGQRSIATVNREMSVLRRMLNIAVQNSWIIKNPFDFAGTIITPGDEKPRERILTRQEEERLLAACTGRREHIKPIIICAIDTGMRRGEILKLKWSDIDFDNNVVTVQAFNTKTMRERQVAMSERLTRELETICARLPEDQEVPVFGITNDIKRAFNSARKAAGLPDVRFHDLRHTYATRLVASHMPLSEVGRVLGHTQANTTFRYVNANVETARRAASIIDEFNRTEVETDLPMVN